MEPQLPLPKYHRIYLVLREQLLEGRFSAALPSETVLSEQFSVARVTVRRALAQLADEGLIERRAGKGTRAVSESIAAHGTEGDSNAKAAIRPNKLTGLLENLVTMGLRTKVKVIEVRHLSAPTEVARALNVERGASVQKAVRVRSSRDGPLSHITTWVPSEISRGFGKAELQSKPILMLLEESGVNVGRAEQSITARLADADLARHLEVSVGTALLAVKRLIYDEADRPVQWLHGFYRPDRYEYQMQLSRVGSIDAKVWVSKEQSANFH